MGEQIGDFQVVEDQSLRTSLLPTIIVTGTVSRTTIGNNALGERNHILLMGELSWFGTGIKNSPGNWSVPAPDECIISTDGEPVVAEVIDPKSRTIQARIICLITGACLECKKNCALWNSGFSILLPQPEA